MKINQFLLILLLATTGLQPQASNAQQQKTNRSPRETLLFNRDWKYAQGNFQDAQATTFDDGKWQSIGLPHSFSTPYFMSKDFYIGDGWYRKRLTLTKADLAKNIFLEFDGVFQETEVFVNGQLVDTHFGGYTGFCIDITQRAKRGDNLIAIRVNNRWRADRAPRAGEHTFSGGIYRNVRLVKKSSGFIDWYGTFIKTPDLEANQGESSTVSIETSVSNRTNRAVTYRLKTEVLDADGQQVTKIESTERVNAGSSLTFQQITPPVIRPELWQPDRPTRYRVVSTLYDGKTAIDQDETQIGFRWFHWSADKGFFLNGKHLYLRGANVHQDYAGWGDAMTEEAMRRDVRMMKEAGFNFIRGSHYPHAPAFSSACDAEGMLFWSEATFWGIGGFKADGYWDSSAYPVSEAHQAAFDQSALQQLTEMIQIHRNHPSIIAWSMSNEPFFSAPEVMDGVRSLLQKMVARSRELDSTRPAAVGGAQRPLGKGRIDLIGDITGYNGDGSSIPEFQHPAVPSIVSEYGSTTADRPGEYTPGWADLAQDWNRETTPWRSGQAIWCGFDHGSIAGSQLGKMGIVDYFRLPKRAWYWYRNEYLNIAPPQWAQAGKPATIQLSASRTKGILTDGTDDVLLTICLLSAEGKEITATPPVTLTVLSGPGEFPTGSSICFEAGSDIRIADGKAAISFRSYYAGTTVIKATSPGLEAVEVSLTFVDGPTYIEGKTPSATERPYQRYVQAGVQPVVQTFGRNNPTFASSSATGHAAGLAADGDEQTWWQPAPDDANVYWTLDTEKGLSLQSIHIRFPQAAAYQYTVAVSADKESWQTLSDHATNTKEESGYYLPLSRPVPARFVRISFQQPHQGVPPRIAEVEVKGVVLD